MEITFALYILVSIIIIIAYWHGYKTGIRLGADTMYQHLYENGIRKNDKVIVTLEYEDRGEIKEF
tara:strand:+ start:90 stop:284 length:195 start_codon:yes stop_codon:yes gene_type:complete